jgi:hypothetical protein
MLTKENEIKVFILYLINYTDCGLSYDDIFNLTEETGITGYFDFSAVFSKLLQENNIRSEDGLYYITERGKTIAENLEHLLPTAIKNKCAVSTARLFDLKKLGADFHSEIEPKNNGYRLVCSIKNKNTKANIHNNNNTNNEIFSVSLFVKEKSAAENMQRIFNERPDYIYRGILAMMSGDADFIL